MIFAKKTSYLLKKKNVRCVSHSEQYITELKHFSANKADNPLLQRVKQSHSSSDHQIRISTQPLFRQMSRSFKILTF